MQYEKHILKNGLRVLLAPMKDTQTVTVLVLTGTGSRYETKKTNGLAHFLEHMFFKGTIKRPTALSISEELDTVGGEYNAYTGKDRTGYWAKVDRKHVHTALDVVSDVFLNAKIEQKQINRERGPILQELSMYEDTPMRHIGDLFEMLLYGNHPLGWEIIGTKQNIMSVNRKDFLAYLEKNYVAQNSAICVAGNFSRTAVLNKIRKDFAKMRIGKCPTHDLFTRKQEKPALSVQNKKTDQTQLMLGVRGYHFNHKDRYVLSVIATLLGGGMSSRLFMEVREKRGLAYFVRTFTEAYSDVGYLVTQAGVKHRNLAQTVKIILAEYRKLARTRVSEKELRKAKEYIKGKIAMGLETSEDVATYLVEQEVIKNRITLPSQIAQRIDRVMAEDVLRVSKDIFRNTGLNCAIIGPHNNKLRVENFLKL